VRKRNVTLALPEELLRQLKIIPARRETSLSALLAEALRQIVDAEQGYEQAQRLMLADLERGYPLGTRGKIDWTRDSLRER
jgi:predicted transcriptional regulator